MKSSWSSECSRYQRRVGDFAFVFHGVAQRSAVDGVEVGCGRGFFVAGVDDAAEVVEHQVGFDFLLDFGDEGVFGGLDESFTGSRGQAKPWNTQALKIDTDDAYQTAIKKSADYIKKNPTMPVSFLLEMTPRFPNLVWRVIWGESVNTSNYSIFVDASTGEYTATGR